MIRLKDREWKGMVTAPVIPAPKEAEASGSWASGTLELWLCVEWLSTLDLAPAWGSRRSLGIPDCLRSRGPCLGWTRSTSNSLCWAVVGLHLQAMPEVPPGHTRCPSFFRILFKKIVIPQHYLCTQWTTRLHQRGTVHTTVRKRWHKKAKKILMKTTLWPALQQWRCSMLC